MNKVTISDVAREADVSITTVSRIINGNYPVKHSTKLKVEKAIQELNFQPNILARGLIQGKTYTIGVLIPSITNMFFSVVISGIQDYFKNKGYQIITCCTDGNAKEEAQALAQLLGHQVDGIISVDPVTANIKNKCYEYAAKQKPLVLVNGYHHGIKLNFILNDHEAGAAEALSYLFSLGHRRIALLRGKSSYSYDIKEQVYYKSLEEKGIPITDELIVNIEEGNSIETIERSNQVITNILSIPNRPTAIFACNDFMAVGASYAATQYGLKVPENLSIIGYDNIIISEIAMTKLTTVDQNMFQLGTAASKMLLQLIGGTQNGYTKQIFDTKLIIRDSCTELREIKY